jgi:hypothetical protein
MALTQYLDQIVPGWMKRDPFAHWFSFVYVAAAGIDAFVAMVDDAARADMPGEVDEVGSDGQDFTSFDALPLIGRDRRIVQGFTESPFSYAAALRRWRDSHRRAGTARELLEQLARILSPDPPRLRIVTAGGVWYTRETDGTFLLQNTTGTGLQISAAGVWTTDTSTAIAWDWDSLTVPANLGKGDMGRIWVVIYCPCNPPYLAGDEGAWGDEQSEYGDDDGDAVEGCSSTAPHVELLRGIGQDWRAAGIKLSHFILAFDPDSFDPTDLSPAAGTMPDGYWGHHGKVVAGVLVPARLGTARYVRGTAGVAY